ncbi:ATP-dependent helicase [Daejeonella sp. JGW-45]|uniref:UvrD-helicase domain-containing protein n=1 Tax=Daejeonella sp. JGW-45 TaxID=3034148 RepID=UPI0023EBC0E3|nr:ATP-dependent helicase [Daejeonella sp. JGW-45]
MQFDITPDNKPYLDGRGKIILNACPGSGKTTAIAYKLGALVKECEQTYGPYAGIACLSFTNTATEEIASKFRGLTNSYLSFPHSVSTLDSFINRYITLPFYYLMGKPSKRPIILDVVSFLDEMNLGYFPAKSKQPLVRILQPSKLKFESTGEISWNGNRPKAQTVDLAIFDKYAATFKNWQLNNGYLNNDDSTYIAFRLLNKFPSIADDLVQRFPYFIIDEAQDTSEIQYKIFDILIAAGLTNIEYVGDPYQSLYEFREARPDLFLARFADTANWKPLRLKDCRRTSQQIINAYSLFRSPAEVSIISSCKHTTDHRLKVLRYDPANLSDLISRYEALIDITKENYILVRGSTHLEMFGAKFSSEQPWKHGAARSLVDAQQFYNGGNVKSAVDTLRKFLVEIQVPAADRKEQWNLREKMKEDLDVNIQLFEFLRRMPSIDDTLEAWTKKVVDFIYSELNVTIDLQLKQKGKAFYALNLKALLYPEINVDYPVTTIHKVKGMTFHSVLLVLSENSTAANISLSEFKKPTGLPSEKQRMIYVALSRPEAMACIAVPNTIGEEKVKEYLGNDIEFA